LRHSYLRRTFIMCKKNTWLTYFKELILSPYITLIIPLVHIKNSLYYSKNQNVLHFLFHKLHNAMTPAPCQVKVEMVKDLNNRWIQCINGVMRQLYCPCNSLLWQCHFNLCIYNNNNNNNYSTQFGMNLF